MKSAKKHLAAFTALALCPLASAQIGSYAQDFESVDINSPDALSSDGWLTYTNVFEADGSFAYGYGSGGAPNGGPSFSIINNTQAGPDQGTQYVNIYSDYNNGDHAIGRIIEANVYRERGIDAADVGQTFTFQFDYRKNPEVNNGDGATEAFAFIKVLKRSDFSFATLTQINFETTSASTTDWATASIDVTIDPAWDGELFQFGFYSTAANYADSSRLYDNLTCSSPNSQPPGLAPYAQDFEGLDAAEGTALGADGWKVFTNVFNPDGSYAYGYGVFDAPNGGSGWSAIQVGSGGPYQGAQAMNIYSDYGNGDHAIGNLIDALVFQEQEIDAANVGQTWRMSFDQLQSPPNNVGTTTTRAFIKVLRRSDFSFAELYLNEFDTTDISQTAWSSTALDITIDPAWAGELMQFGFASLATNYQDSGRYYDNIDWAPIANPGLGRVVCLGNPTSTGSGALLTATGSAVAADNDLTLTVDGLPANQMGLFFQSPTGVTVYNPAGSEGHLCIASFDIGRFPTVSNSGAAGSVSTSVDLASLPSAAGHISVIAGNTHQFQFWTRDTAGMTATSNFSSAVSITFQ
ncbi:MAG: hypothetical protein VXZ39_05720 [Planctomycetota bacterium]|nr:hypothetical protein [Planctomycetota bacterium]